MTVSRGLGLPAVALAGVGHMPAKGNDEKETARDLCGGDKRHAGAGHHGKWWQRIWEQVAALGHYSTLFV